MKAFWFSAVIWQARSQMQQRATFYTSEATQHLSARTEALCQDIFVKAWERLERSVFVLNVSLWCIIQIIWEEERKRETM